MSKSKPESIKEVEDYAKSIDFDLDGEEFIAHYDMVGWVYGKARLPIKNWKACVVTWKKMRARYNGNGRKYLHGTICPKCATETLYWLDDKYYQCSKCEWNNKPR